MPRNKSDANSDSVRAVSDPRAFLPMEKCNFEIPEAARILCISRSGLYDLIAEGKLATVTFGRRRIVPGAALAHVIASFAADAKTGGIEPRRVRRDEARRAHGGFEDCGNTTFAARGRFHGNPNLESKP